MLIGLKRVTVLNVLPLSGHLSYKISWALLEVMASLRQGSLQVIYLNCYIFWESLNENCKYLSFKAILTRPIHILHHHFDGTLPNHFGETFSLIFDIGWEEE